MRRLAAVGALLLSLAALSAQTASPRDGAVSLPSLTWSLLPEEKLRGPARAWAIGAAGTAVAAGLGWSVYEAGSLLRPFFAILGGSDLSKAPEALGRVSADPDFQAHLFGFAFGVLATGLAADILDHAVHEIGKTSAPPPE